MGTAQVQGALWGARPRDWAALQEVAFRMLYETVFDAVDIKRGTQLADIGCGAGLACEIAHERGASVSGLDASSALIEIAKGRCPRADLRVGEMEELPFDDYTFDVVTGFNSFQYAADPARALGEAKRTAKPEGLVVAAVWGEAAKCELAGYLGALGKLLPPPPPGAPGPFALSAPGALEALMQLAGLRPASDGNAPVNMTFRDEAAAICGLLASGPATRAVQHSGEEAVRKGIAEAIAPYRKLDGSYVLRNEFKYVVSRT